MGIRVESFFERVRGVWPDARRDLHWHVLPTEKEAAALGRPFARFARPGLVGVPDEWLHCTLLHAIGVGADDVDLEALVEAAAGPLRHVEPFDLVFDRPAIGAVAVELSGWPGAAFDQVAGVVVTATAAAAPGFRPGVSRYPHISVAYTTDGAQTISAVDLKSELAAVEGPVSSTVHVDRVHLVEQEHDGASITWRPIAEVKLGTAL